MLSVVKCQFARTNAIFFFSFIWWWFNRLELFKQEAANEKSKSVCRLRLVLDPSHKHSASFTQFYYHHLILIRSSSFLLLLSLLLFSISSFFLLFSLFYLLNLFLCLYFLLFFLFSFIIFRYHPFPYPVFSTKLNTNKYEMEKKNCKTILRENKLIKVVSYIKMFWLCLFVWLCLFKLLKLWINRMWYMIIFCPWISFSCISNWTRDVNVTFWMNLYVYFFNCI